MEAAYLCASRELREETGLTIDLDVGRAFYRFPRGTDHFYCVCVADTDGADLPTQPQDQDEISAAFWLPLDDFLRSGVQRTLLADLKSLYLNLPQILDDVGAPAHKVNVWRQHLQDIGPHRPRAREPGAQ